MLVLVIGAVAGTMWWLLVDPAATTAPAPAASPGASSVSSPAATTPPPQAAPASGSTPRGEILRTALAAGAAVGAAVTLALAFRRQRHQEVATLAATHDANERRVTELYTKAAEQLGSDKAAVRLAGLYALERLAQDNPGHRQTIVNVICAYLRMPYALPTPEDPEEARKTALRDARRRYQAARTFGGSAVATAAAAPASSAEADLEGERQVRLTAQLILADHLRDERLPGERDTPANPRFWAGMRIDLMGAALIDFDFRNCHVESADFDRTFFSGLALFTKATFCEPAYFNGSHFSQAALFDGATFSHNASFSSATFSGEALFDRAVFSGFALFQHATFARKSSFDSASFSGETYFASATFGESASFHATFAKTTSFTRATFAGEALFGLAAGSRVFYFEPEGTVAERASDQATFAEDAHFSLATFSGAAGFGEVAFFKAAIFGGATFSGTVGFGRATFSGATFYGSAVVHAPDADHELPIGWQLEKQPDGTGRLVSDDDATPETA